MKEIGYKIQCIKTGLFKHRAGGTLWSDVGDIYYSLPRVKSVLKSHMNYGRGKTRGYPVVDKTGKCEMNTQFKIIEYEIQATGKEYYE